jgi:predicted NBD/HSP70 family sugar kinase
LLLMTGRPSYCSGRSWHKKLRDLENAGLSQFDDRCPCGERGHLDAFATPKRIRHRLGVETTKDAASAPSLTNGRPSEASHALRAAGAVLGRGLSHVINIVNPSRLILFLPAELLNARPETAGAAYLKAAKAEMSHAYSTGARFTNLTPRSLEEGDSAVLGARAAAVCLLNSFLDHARGLDGCPIPLRRVGKTAVTRESAPALISA